jgi:uncharacterized membrane protein
MRFDRLNWLILTFGLLGLIDSLWLTYWHFANPVIHSIRNSSYGNLAGVPVALLGAIVYLSIVMVIAFGNHVPAVRQFGQSAVFLMSGAGMIFSIYLLGASIMIFHSICPYCLFSALMISAIFICCIVRMAGQSRAAIG